HLLFCPSFKTICLLIFMQIKHYFLKHDLNHIFASTMITKQNGNIPISISLEDTLKSEGAVSSPGINKWRILLIAGYAVVIAAVISCLAKLLVLLINAITNLSFYGTF